MKWKRFYDAGTDLGTRTDTTEETQIDLGNEKVDVDVIHTKAEEVIKKEKEAKTKEVPPKVDNSKEELLQKALDRIEALEQKNANLERSSILDKFDKKALEGLKEKGIDLSTYSNDELSKTAKLMSAMGVTNKPVRTKHDVTPNDGIDTEGDFMTEWNKAKGRK